MPLQTYMILRGIGQFTPDALVSLEQFQLGGATSVRGYQEGRLLGDSGFALSAEWRVPWLFIPESVNIKGYSPRRNLEFVSFVDFGGVYGNRTAVGVNPLRGTTLHNSSTYALGVGVGVRAKVTRLLNARVDVGFPCIRQSPDGAIDARVHFGLESRLF